MRSRASRAMYGSVATRTATAWPTKYARAPASAVCLGAFRSGMAAAHGTAPHASFRSAPVRTAATPGSCRAAAVSMLLMRAWACGLRRMTACSMPGILMSSVNVPAPVNRRGSSTRFMGRPTCTVRVSAMRHLLSLLRRMCDRIHDVRVAGAPAQVAAQAFRDLPSSRRRLVSEEMHRRHHHAGRAEATLETVAFPEALLNRVQSSVCGEALDGRQVRSLGLHGEHRARLHRLAVDEHGARAADARLAPDVGPGQVAEVPQVVNQEETRFNRVVVRSRIDAKVDGNGHSTSSERGADPSI